MNASTHPIQARIGVLALVLAAACDDGPVKDDGASFREGDVLVIDSFKTGPVELQIDGVDAVQSSQTGTEIYGDWRCLELGASVNEFDRPLSVEVREGEGGFLALDSGVGVQQSMTLIYGPGPDCGPAGLDLDLTPYSHLRLEFADIPEGHGALDQDLGGGIVVWSDSGSSSIPLSIVAQSPNQDFAIADFVGDVEWKHIRQIAVVMQSGGAVPGHDYVLRSFAAVDIAAQ